MSEEENDTSKEKESFSHKKILNHPDREKIIERLLAGESLKDIELWIQKKYPRSKRLHISYMSLQRFRSGHLNLKGQVLEDIKTKKLEEDKKNSELEAQLIIKTSSAYQQKINEIASNELDVTRRLLELDKLISARIESYFNLVQSGNFNSKSDEVLLQYINTMRALLGDWKKYIEGFADKKVEHNVNINIINEQTKILKESVLDVLREMDPRLIPIFVDKVDYKMKLLTSDIKKDIIDV